MKALVIAALVVGCARGDAPTTGGTRIVTLMPSGTEVVAALGATAQLVGVDSYSTYPPEVAALPKVGDFLHPSVEAIVRLHPTLVVVDDVHAAVAAGLKGANVPTVECAMHALPDVRAALRAVGDKLGKTREADAKIAEIDAAIDAARGKRPVKHPKVLAVIDRDPNAIGDVVAAGPGTWLDELLAIVGGDNVLIGSPQRYPKVSTETILRSQPDVIIDLSKHSLGAWNSLDVPAVKTGRVRALDAPYLGGPSPRVGAALDDLANAIR